jgi:hypothetical protein
MIITMLHDDFIALFVSHIVDGRLQCYLDSVYEFRIW